MLMFPSLQAALKDTGLVIVGKRMSTLDQIRRKLPANVPVLDLMRGLPKGAGSPVIIHLDGTTDVKTAVDPVL